MEDAEHLYSLIKGFENTMLVTRAADGHLHARPMLVAELKPDADAYFVTSVVSPKIAEIYADADVLLTFQNEHQYAAVYGHVNVVRDPALIGRLWRDAWKAWFPRGVSDPSIALLRFDAERGEFWEDIGIPGAQYQFEAGRANLSGARQQQSPERHGRARL